MKLTLAFYCKRLLSTTTKKEYFNNLDTKRATDNITFWRTVVILNVDGKTVSEKKKELCRIFRNYFANVVFDLQTPNI